MKVLALKLEAVSRPVLIQLTILGALTSYFSFIMARKDGVTSRCATIAGKRCGSLSIGDQMISGTWYLSSSCDWALKQWSPVMTKMVFSKSNN